MVESLQILGAAQSHAPRFKAAGREKRTWRRCRQTFGGSSSLDQGTGLRFVERAAEYALRMGKGYAEGSAVEERLAALERGDDLSRQLDGGRAAVYGSTDDDPETHFLGWLDDVDPDALFAAGDAWGLQIVRRPKS
jgi:hypothetical protein